MRVRTPLAVVTIVALAASALLLPRPGDGAGEARSGRALVGARCAGCHGPEGNGGAATVPRLAGQDADYLYRQLQAFRDGARASPVMDAVAAALTDRQMRDASTFLAGQARRGDAVASAALDAEGRALFQQGSDDGRVPACAACHDASRGWFAGGMRGMHGGGGMPMMGMMGAQGPRLLGQRAGYIEQRLAGFADGTPQAARMDRIAHAMSERQKQAVAAYLAAHP